MAIPTFEEYQKDKPEASWVEYVSRFSAMAAQKQVEAGEIPSDYGSGHSFTPAGVWVKSGSMAAIGGLPGEIKEIFPGVEKTYSEAYEKAVDNSVITSSRAGEPQTSFDEIPGIDRTVSEYGSTAIGGVSGGSAPIEFNEVDKGGSTSPGTMKVDNIAQFQVDFLGSQMNTTNGNGDPGMGIIGLLLLLAMGI